ncbi:MAG: TIGR04086 family membrane protein [Candidatus Methanomethylicota archaeon]|uniref:TIGR04086 family membrane protein n=1 Tax=Thermoproteota archaeon TaxID=2056631 RepID=A0A497EU43_9CREN|nr:MAG: TIGR04086 family membrane protein [Candidatus Verstraetearchaeota archaeon]
MKIRGRMPNFDEYLAGAMLANAPGWFAIAISSYLFEIALINEIALQISIMTSYFIGGLIGAYLVANKAYRDRVRVGVEVGFAAFILNFIFTALLSIPTPILYTLPELLMGGFIGGVISHRKL